MTKPNEFRRQISQLSHDDFNIRASSITSEEEKLNQLRYLKGKLRKIRKEIQVEIDAVRTNFEGASKETISEAIVDLIFMRKSVKNKGWPRKKQLVKERDQLLASYEAVKSTVDDLLNQMEDEQAKLSDFIEQSRKEMGKHNVNNSGEIYYYDYLETQKWRQKAEEAKARSGNRCQVCNRPRAEVQLDAHHRTYERLGDELPEDLTVLCRDCHQLYEEASTLPMLY